MSTFSTELFPVHLIVRELEFL